jgi:hypothetical protein
LICFVGFNLPTVPGNGGNGGHGGNGGNAGHSADIEIYVKPQDLDLLSLIGDMRNEGVAGGAGGRRGLFGNASTLGGNTIGEFSILKIKKQLAKPHPNM